MLLGKHLLCSEHAENQLFKEAVYALIELFKDLQKDFDKTLTSKGKKKSDNLSCDCSKLWIDVDNKCRILQFSLSPKWRVFVRTLQSRNDINEHLHKSSC